MGLKGTFKRPRGTDLSLSHRQAITPPALVTLMLPVLRVERSEAEAGLCSCFLPTRGSRVAQHGATPSPALLALSGQVPQGPTLCVGHQLLLN